MSITVLHISDSHAGLLSGLFPPELELTYASGEKIVKQATSWSLFVWDCYQRAISTAIDFAQGDPVIVVHTGDCTHGSTFAEYQYSGWIDHQVVIAVRCLAELRRIPNLAAIRLCYGTAAHDYGMQSATKLIADDLGAWGIPLWCGAYGVEDVDGLHLDYAHRGPIVNASEDRGISPRRYAIRLARTFLERGRKAPDIILRGHVHRKYLEEVTAPWGKEGHRMIVSIAAPLTGPNEFARNVTQNTPITECGGALIRVQNGRVVDWLGASWERENRSPVAGTVAHPFAGDVNRN